MYILLFLRQNLTVLALPSNSLELHRWNIMPCYRKQVLAIFSLVSLLNGIINIGISITNGICLAGDL